MSGPSSIMANVKASLTSLRQFSARNMPKSSAPPPPPDYFPTSSSIHVGTSRGFARHFRSACIFLLPSFLARKGRPDEPLRSTAFLDGLRGIAAFAVYIHHMTYLIFEEDQAWTAEHNHNWFRMPILKLIIAGPAAVLVFFVVSGYSLSLKPVQQMRNGERNAALLTLQSALFRRPLRLYLPIIASTFLVALCVNIGAFDFTRPFHDDKIVFKHMLEQTFHRPAGGMLSGESGSLPHWLKEIIWLCITPIRHWSDGGFHFSYDPHLWTLPIEFFASITLFVTMIALAGVRTRMRLLILSVLLVLSVVYDWWAMTLFWAGWMLVEVNSSIVGPKLLPMPLSNHQQLGVSTTYPRLASVWQKVRVPFHVLNFICALYLLSAPEYWCNAEPFHMALCLAVNPKVVIPWRFWASLGAIQLVAGVSNAPFLARIFTTRPINYLGKLSFALYLVHGLVNHLFGVVVFWCTFTLIGQETTTAFRCAYLMGLALNTVMVIWVADIFMRLVDEPSVKLARRFEKWCFA